MFDLNQYANTNFLQIDSSWAPNNFTIRWVRFCIETIRTLTHTKIRTQILNLESLIKSYKSRFQRPYSIDSMFLHSHEIKNIYDSVNLSVFHINLKIYPYLVWIGLSSLSVLAGFCWAMGKSLSKISSSHSSLNEIIKLWSMRGLYFFGIFLFSAIFFKLTLLSDLSAFGILMQLSLVCLFGLLGAVMGKIMSYRFKEGGPTASGLRDIRRFADWFKGMNAYDPVEYIDIDKGVFVGLEQVLDAQGKINKNEHNPIYVPWPLFRETHAQILGSTGSGKGISLGVLGYQFILNREALIVFDPKGDARLPLVLSLAANKIGSEFVHLDLQAQSFPQFNILEGASAIEIEELLVAGLGLQPSSGEGNYYRGIDQDAAEQVSKLAKASLYTKTIALPELLKMAQTDKHLSKADNFIRRLRQVCDLRAIQTTHGINISEHIKRGNVIYIRGSTDNHRVKMLQTMLLIRILQIVKSRYLEDSKSQTRRSVCMILDEFKHLLSPVALDMLGVVREMGCHALLAHQSLADLAACPGLDRKDVEPVVVDNATLKLVFRIGDEQAAKGFANKSGQQKVYKETIKPVQNAIEYDKSWAEAQQTRISQDMFLHLHRPSESKSPYTAGVLFGLGLAKLFFLSPVMVSGSLQPPLEAPSQTQINMDSLEDLI